MSVFDVKIIVTLAFSALLSLFVFADETSAKHMLGLKWLTLVLSCVVISVRLGESISTILLFVESINKVSDNGRLMDLTVSRLVGLVLLPFGVLMYLILGQCRESTLVTFHILCADVYYLLILYLSLCYFIFSTQYVLGILFNIIAVEIPANIDKYLNNLFLSTSSLVLLRKSSVVTDYTGRCIA